MKSELSFNGVTANTINHREADMLRLRKEFQIATYPSWFYVLLQIGKYESCTQHGVQLHDTQDWAKAVSY